MSSVDRIAQAFQADTRRGLQKALGFSRPALRLPEIQRLSEKLASFREERRRLKVGILRTYTTELLRPYWSFESLLAGFDLDLYEAPLGSLLQQGQAGSPLLELEPDATFLFLRWHDLDPRFQRPLAPLSPADRDDLADAAGRRIVSLVAPLREALPGLLIVTLLPPLPGPGAFLGAETAENQAARDFAARVKAGLIRMLESFPAAHFFDLDQTRDDVGLDAFFDARLWQVAQFPFSVRGAQAVVRGLFTLAWLPKGPLTKCIVLDADNTLWGGIVGEDGPEGIALGPGPPGDAYVAFQRRLLALRSRGILLALCSRNNRSDVSRVLAEHPRQLLREEHFAALRVNWDSKAENLQSIAEELRLGLENLLFVDDSPQECLLVEQRLPEVMVVRVPETLAEIPSCLDGWPGLERLNLTPEDSDRARYYADDRQRRRLEVQSSTVEDYLGQLRMVMTIGFDDPAAAARIAQLTQKTNQFNLTTRRYTEAEIGRWMRDPDRLVAHFSLADIFGDSGVVGVAILNGAAGLEPEFDTFLLSCRVIGRSAETAFLHALLGVLRERGVTRVRGRFVPSGRNALVQNFWSEHGFGAVESGLFEQTLTAEGADRSSGPISVIISSRASAPDAPKEGV